MLSRDRYQDLRRMNWLVHLAGVLSLVAGGALYQAVVSTLIDREKREIAAESVEKEKFLAQAQDVRAEHKALTTRLEQLENNAVNMRQRIPEQPREAEFLKHVTQAADDEGLKILRYERGPIDRKPTHSEFTVRLSCEGDYRAVVGFLDRLAKLPRVATVRSMSLTSGATTTYPFDLSLVLYYGAQSAEVRGS